ncbi:gamma-glutamyl-gamma-aminobutyrate hydrolase family protein, partial [Myxococcota bacterium]|nr:gamma-glutamyl-gamma-aminobutyrate hydrolase family protein [Myxococcota bacterium]
DAGAAPRAVAERAPVAPRTPATKRGEQLSAIERSPSFRAEVARVGFEVVRVAGAPAEILLPVEPGKAGQSWGEYVRRLAKTCSFPEQRDVITELGRVAATTAMPLGADPRPVVGVLCSEPEQLLSAGEAQSSRALVAELERRGFRPVLVPPRADLLLSSDRVKRWAGLTALVSKLDGVAGPGGADVHPRIYGQLNRFSVETNYPRDRFEADVAMVALRSDVFMLGICRSHQLWNAATGGALVQDVRKEGYSSTSQNQDDFGIPMTEPFVVRGKGGAIEVENRVHTTPGSRLAKAVGRSSFVTNSFHHQAVARPGAPFAVSGVVHDPVTKRDTIEATEASNAITVQWHPELAKRSSPADRAILDTFARRVEIFHIVRELRARGEEPTTERVRAQMSARTDLAFTAADHDWVKRDLADRLARSAV